MKIVNPRCSFGKRALGKKLFKASSQRQGARIFGEHPAVQDRSKISWFIASGGFNLRRGSGVVPWHPPVRSL